MASPSRFKHNRECPIHATGFAAWVGLTHTLPDPVQSPNERS